MTAPTHTVELGIAADHPAFAGHFPGRPLLPGVALLSAVLAEPALAAAVGAAPRLGAVKFLVPVEPGAALTIRFDATRPGALRFEVVEDTRIAASGSFECAAAAVSSAASANRASALP